MTINPNVCKDVITKITHTEDLGIYFNGVDVVDYLINLESSSDNIFIPDSLIDDYIITSQYIEESLQVIPNFVKPRYSSTLFKNYLLQDSEISYLVFDENNVRKDSLYFLFPVEKDELPNFIRNNIDPILKGTTDQILINWFDKIEKNLVLINFKNFLT